MLKRLFVLFVVLPVVVFAVMWAFMNRATWAGVVVGLFSVALVVAPAFQIIAGITGRSGEGKRGKGP